MVRQTLARAVLRTALIGGVFAGCLPAPPAVLAGTFSPPVTPHPMKQRPAAAPYAMPVDFPAIVDAARAHGIGPFPLSGFSIDAGSAGNGLVLGFGNTSADAFEPMLRMLSAIAEGVGGT